MNKIAIFASGAGSNAKKIIEHFLHSPLAEVVLVACNKPGAGVIAIAKDFGVQVLDIEKEKFFRGDGYVSELRSAKIDIIVLAGFLWKIPDTLINAYRNKIINIHPALLPKYGGKGMYGAKVHEAVIAAREKQSGITIHYVDEHYDNGDIILQAVCDIDEHDSADTLAQKVHHLEHTYYPQAIEKIILQSSYRL